jgi:hypothetical protein
VESLAVAAFFAVIVAFAVGYWIGVHDGRRAVENERRREQVRQADE